MIKNYILLFARNLRRQKMFSFINLLGLTVSICSTLLIYLYVRNEFSYDRFHKDADRIYRVNQTFIWGEGDKNQFASTGPGVANALKEELPEMELITSIHTPGDYIISYTNEKNEVISFEQDFIFAADSNFFKMFTFPFTHGSPEGALLQANTLVMTETTAKKYFGEINPVGKLVRLTAGDTEQTFEVTGVIQDTPENSYLKFNALLSMTSFPVIKKLYWSWVWTQLETFIRVAPHTDIENTRAKLAKIPPKHAEQSTKAAMGMTYEEYVKSGKKWELFLQPLTSIHLPSSIVYNRLNDAGNITIIYALIGAAIFIVLLSCINFMNLSTAQFTRRIKEASIRKIMGLGRGTLSALYFLEAFSFCLLALVAALAFTQILLPGFNSITGKGLQLSLATDPTLMISILILMIVMALLAGSYPAFFLTAFNPAEALRGKLKSGTGGKKFRNGLVIFQFSVSIFLIICTSVVYRQLNFFSKKDLGFNKENLLVLENVSYTKNGESLANDAVNVPGVVSATWCTSLPPTVWGGDTFSAGEKEEKKLPLNFTNVDEQFIPTLGIKMKVGRNFSKDIPGDVDRVILNETAVRKIEWDLDETVIGKSIRYPGSERKFEVVGVMSDFNYWSLQSPIEPMAIFHIKNKSFQYPRDKQFVAIRIAAQNSDEWAVTLKELNNLWKVHAGSVPFQYLFVDQAFAQTFKTQQQFGNVLTVMAILAILIASLGLLGMIIYTLEQRTKEIGIRKVSGASIWNILTLISKEYTRLIVIAFVIGAPLSYWIMKQWLQDFAFRIPLTIGIFLLAGAGTLLIAVLITSYHSIQAALMNPVDVLKDE
ncbi:MAG TPA: ABC transporter permease [Cyclobacteriaceae bacterium]|nr:ABC transporter permease [Cyclobacteriaceae bacterium]